MLKDITFFTKYTTRGASSRYRHYHFFSRLLKYNYNLEIKSFLDIGYLDRLYSEKRMSKLKIVLAYLNRLIDLKLSSENLIVEYELFPYVPYWVEKRFLRDKRYILNYDDNLWYNCQKNPLLRNKYDNLVKEADGIIVANDFLYQKIRKLNQNVIKIPTVIDVENIGLRAEKYSTFTIAWIGTPSTYKFILSHRDIFRKLSEKIQYDLLIIASTRLEKKGFDGVSVIYKDWSPETEYELLTKSHIGIMPLDMDEFCRGKSGFKIIQYIACGLPVVATDIGENRRIIENGKNGFLVSSADEWIESIIRLRDDNNLYNEIACHNREVSCEYSIQKYFDIYRGFVDKCFDHVKPL
jgi:glycosyltransferase involved in cell wall biosynthesis